MKVAGYANPWHGLPGDAVELHLSTSTELDAVKAVRLDKPSPEIVDWQIVSTGVAPAWQDIEQGSFLEIRAAVLAKAGRIDGVAFDLFLTRNSGDRVIAETDTFTLGLRDGSLGFSCGGKRFEDCGTIPSATWLHVEIRSSADGVLLDIRSFDVLAPFHLVRQWDILWKEPTNAVRFGANAQADLPSLNAKFSSISLISGESRIDWQFPTLLPDGPIASNDPLGLLLDVHGQPTFCMTSPRWNGKTFDPRLAPTHYDAVHCHDDDMAALEWPSSYRATIPDDAEAGVYAFEAAFDGGVERIVFFVVSKRAKAPLLFLVPTATYLAYADEALPPHLYEWKCDDRGHRFAVDNNLRSLYDYHSDVSGVSICSYRKPKVTVRDDYNYPLCGCPHNLPVDLHFLRFCQRNGIAYDLATDHHLHARGADLLDGYTAVVTGSHPEYMSVEIEGALRHFASSGGSIAYLGGNGFAGKVAFKGDLMELRRSPLEAGRTWDGPISEQSLSITNEPGGHLRASGRGEFSLVGGAISLMGFDGARPFERTAASYEPQCAWLFDGVSSAVFGESGMVLGGAAGYEVDATDPHLGTSPDTTVIARATGFPAGFVHDATRWYEGGDEELQTRRCAEMTLRHLPAGGMIFSASSVAWCGALPENDMNDVGKITLNLLRRFASAKGSANAADANENQPVAATGNN